MKAHYGFSRMKGTKNPYASSMKAKIPAFKSEQEERAFWASRDSTDYLDWKKGKKAVFPNLRPTVKPARRRKPSPGPAGRHRRR